MVLLGRLEITIKSPNTMIMLDTVSARIQDAIHNADNFDIILVFVAYLGMWYSLIKVFR